MSPKFCHNHQPLWICSLRIDVEDLGTDKYYSVAEEIGRRVSSAAGTAAASPTATQTLGLVACGTGVGISIFANKFPSVFAATCLSPGDALNARSINNSNNVAAMDFGDHSPEQSSSREISGYKLPPGSNSNISQHFGWRSAGMAKVLASLGNTKPKPVKGSRMYDYKH
ncbi:hypothetical protein RJ640_006779 [Escallonia rubra]|uniref:Uncharacterized protein n=1 Tax=Escallonia rubra TaxID=112253 RepID=A0AA88RDA6_9ASTE|nr:hypothetical protein RJ640_006779 [Escallonia rubra]